METIKGGYVLQPRSFDQSEVSKFPPHVREIFLYLIRKANHKNVEGRKLARGQLLTSYKQIINDLSWYVGYRKESYKKHHCETAMKLLTKQHMVTTTKTTRGMIVTVCNYDFYQSPKSYETDSESDNVNHKKPTMNRQDRQEPKNVQERNRLVSKLSLTEREQKFYDELKTYHPKYPKETLRAFYDYWTEPNRSNTKMRFELEKTWSTKRRLSTWASREKPTAQATQKPPNSYNHIERWKPEDDQIDPELEKELEKNFKSL